jgi:BirA family biotin operon repressor/biotin-[acetyl-CoA-carboxylase] ligase
MPKNSNLLSYQATLLPIGNPFIELPTVESTNNYAMAQARKGNARHGAAFFAHHQTAGKGQRGKSWTADPGENIIMSIVLQPIELKPSDSFHLSAAVATACYDFFKNSAGPETSVKWPNDIYWRDRKAGGILIENVIQKGFWTFSIVGIGMNINQTAFDANLPNPVSLKQITGKSYDPVVQAKELCGLMQVKYQELISARHTSIDRYNEALYKRNELVRLKRGNIVFETRLKGVSAYGTLITFDQMEHEFGFGEIEWIP